MDAHALLVSQGWRGKGHSLHPTSDDRGLKHHLLIRREGNDGRGLGIKKDHKVEAWWLNAFDQALKGIDSNGTNGGLKQNAQGAKLDIAKITARGAGKYTGSRGLYHSFVKAGTLQGSISENGGIVTPPHSGTATPTSTDSEAGKTRTKAEKKARKEARTLKKVEKEARAKAKAAAKAAKEGLKAGETKEERKARREAKRARKEQKRAGETKEDRKARREVRRARKEKRRRGKSEG